MKKSFLLLITLVVIFIYFGADKSIANASNQHIENKIPGFYQVACFSYAMSLCRISKPVVRNSFAVIW